jgi:hypothetical protein
MSGRKLAVKGEWKPEYPRAQIRVSNFNDDGVIRNGLPADPYLPRDPERRARLLADLGIEEDADFLTPED